MEMIKGVGALGITYHSCPYWGRRTGKPSLHLSLWFIKLIIKLPWQDLTEKGKGTYTSSYGVFWWPSLNWKVKLFWECK